MRSVRLLPVCLSVCLFAITGIVPSAEAQTTAPNEWTWIGGSSTVPNNCAAAPSTVCGQPAVYGALGTPAAGNSPGGRADAVSWTDSGGNLWLFGGGTSDSNGDSYFFNDLWKFDISANEWGWMGGSATANQPGVYGIPGKAAAGNIPGARDSALSWIDNSGHVWLFGGQGYDSAGVNGQLNDLWELDPLTNEWTWMGGSSTVGANGGQPGVYGAPGTPAAGNTPGGRCCSVGWADGNGDLWLFGGYGYDSKGTGGSLSDLWEFNSATGEWAWMGGGTAVYGYYNGPQPDYGTLGTPAPSNIPGSRDFAVSWTGNDGNFWLLGGLSYDVNYDWGYFNDLWEFGPSTGEWAWMGGSSTVPSFGTGHPGVYGTLGTPAAGNVPGGRAAAASWRDSGGDFWLFSGYYIDGYYYENFNDLWVFNPFINEWAWMGGSGTGNCYASGTDSGCTPQGVYGNLGKPAAGNTPGGRTGEVTWTDRNGNLWLYGGGGFDSVDNEGFLNDLWVYQPAVPAALTAPVTGSQLTGTSASFSWTAGNKVTNYWLDLGTAASGAAAKNIYSSGSITSRAETVTGLPANGETIYVTLYSEIGGTWRPTVYAYTASGSPSPAALTSPAANSTLTSTSVTFIWSPANPATDYLFNLGTASSGVNAKNIYSGNSTTATSVNVTGIPTNGETIYATLYSYVAGGWSPIVYSYTTSGTPVAAVLNTPTPSTKLLSSSVTFSWSAGEGVTNYRFNLGTASSGVNAKNIYSGNSTTATSVNVTGLPTDGETVYATLYSYIAGAWQPIVYTYTASGSPTPAALTTPSPNTTLSGTSVVFCWSAGSNVPAYWFNLGTGASGVSSKNIYSGGSTTATQIQVIGLPTNGETIYATL